MEIKFNLNYEAYGDIEVRVSPFQRTYEIDGVEDIVHVRDEISNKIIPLILEGKLMSVDLNYVRFNDDIEIIPGFLYATDLGMGKVYSSGPNLVYVGNEVDTVVGLKETGYKVESGTIDKYDDDLKMVHIDSGTNLPYIIFESLRNLEAVQGIMYYPFKVLYEDKVSPFVQAVKRDHHIIFQFKDANFLLGLSGVPLAEDKIETHLNFLMGAIEADDDLWSAIYDVLSFYAKGDYE